MNPRPAPHHSVKAPKASSWSVPAVDRVVAHLRPEQHPELAEGDLIFGNRLSWMQRVMNISGDFLTHVGVVALVEDEIAVIELGPQGCFTRTVDEFTSRYRFYAFGRPSMHAACVRRVVASAQDDLRRADRTYSMAACCLLEAFMLARRLFPERFESRLNSLGRRMTRWFLRWVSSTDVTCSGFVYELLQSAPCRHCRPDLSWPTRPRVSPLDQAPWLSDVRPHDCVQPEMRHDVVRTLVMPYDLWSALRYDFKVIVRDGVTTVVVDNFDGDPDPTTVQIAS